MHISLSLSLALVKWTMRITGKNLLLFFCKLAVIKCFPCSSKVHQLSTFTSQKSTRVYGVPDELGGIKKGEEQVHSIPSVLSR